MRMYHLDLRARTIFPSAPPSLSRSFSLRRRAPLPGTACSRARTTRSPSTCTDDPAKVSPNQLRADVYGTKSKIYFSNLRNTNSIVRPSRALPSHLTRPHPLPSPTPSLPPDLRTGTPLAAPFMRNKLTMAMLSVVAVLQAAWVTWTLIPLSPLIVVFVVVVLLVRWSAVRSTRNDPRTIACSPLTLCTAPLRRRSCCRSHRFTRRSSRWRRW